MSAMRNAFGAVFGVFLALLAIYALVGIVYAVASCGAGRRART